MPIQSRQAISCLFLMAVPSSGNFGRSKAQSGLKAGRSRWGGPHAAAHIAGMTSANLPSAETSSKPVLMMQRLKRFLMGSSLVIVPVAITAVLFGSVYAIYASTMTSAENALQSSISMSEDQLFDAGLDELNTMRSRIESFNENGGGTPAVNERELDRIDAVVLEIIDAQ